MSITPARISSLSTEYVNVSIAIAIGNVQVPINPLVDTVKCAFMPIDLDGNASNPSGANWVLASWYLNQTVQPFIIQCLVGPGVGGVITLLPGRYNMWIQVFDNPETVVQQAPGFLTVY